MPKSLNFQSIIKKLLEFWAEQDCLIWQPYYTQVGAGTMNPATALRVLGPEPWRVAYVEPSIRPDDGRYGKNPNRMQMHYQIQVILKPDPGNPQELYLKSLAAVGIDPLEHDIRFVEDNWESPALSAWGLGWEVWLDGQEITQFTYFQQSGGQILDPVSVEITYGLERIAIALQRVHSFRDIQWSPLLTDGDVNLQAEQEHSMYYYETADVDRLRRMYDLFEAEAEACLEKRLVLPAHDYVLKCSHTFNILDTRGVIGVTDRQAYFGRMRGLSKRVSEAYIEQRMQLEYPWLADEDVAVSVTKVRAAADDASTIPAKSPQPFLLEIGTEELPVADLESAVEQVNTDLEVLLNEVRLEYNSLEVFGTPRRIVAYIGELSCQQPDLEHSVKGPPAARAFETDGTPTGAAIGFARSRGIPVDELQIQELDGGQYVVAAVSEKGRPAQTVLSEKLPELMAGLRFKKSMRWNGYNVNFSRPIRWLLALHGDEPVPFTYAGLTSGRDTRGLRFLEPTEKQISNTQNYFQFLEEQGIILDVDQRRTVIESQMRMLAADVGGEITSDQNLLTEVTNLVEAPTALLGEFDRSHLQLPREVLVSVMKKHQRYFPVERDGELLPYFITIANKPTHNGNSCQGADAIKAGNEHVIWARFADAEYFIREDQKKSLQAFRNDLSKLIFQVQLGSMLDKSQRIEKLVELFADQFDFGDVDINVTKRAAHLCKADLATDMVVEMTSLQGVMGRYYAIDSGELPDVAEAIYEHYLPRFAGDETPKSTAGLLVGVADRLDTLAGLFAAGLAPTGNKDPYAQRRGALGLVQNLIAWDFDLDLRAAIHIAEENLPIPASVTAEQACLNFIIERLRNLLLEKGWRFDVVDAVVSAQGYNPAGAVRAAEQLTHWTSRADWHTILPAYARCVRITRSIEQAYAVNPELLVEPAEIDLHKTLLSAEAADRNLGSAEDFLSVFLPLIPAINLFFDEVLVMVDDEALQGNRLGLLQRIAALANEVVDLSRLEGF